MHPSKSSFMLLFYLTAVVLILSPSAQAGLAIVGEFSRFAQKNGFIVSEPTIFDDESQNPGYNPDLKETSRTTFRDGLIYTSRGQLLDTADRDQIYVLNYDGVLYTSASMPIHHSYFLTKNGIGKSVACAGQIRAKDGKILYIDTNSGHYQPIKDQLILAIQYLYRQGVLAVNVDILANGTLFLDTKSGKPTGFLSLQDILQEAPQAILNRYPASVKRTSDYIEASRAAISDFRNKFAALKDNCPKNFINSPVSSLLPRFSSPTKPGRFNFGGVNLADKKWGVMVDNYYWEFPENITNVPASEFMFGNDNKSDIMRESSNGIDIKIGACKYSFSRINDPQKNMILWLIPLAE